MTRLSLSGGSALLKDCWLEGLGAILADSRMDNELFRLGCRDCVALWDLASPIRGWDEISASPLAMILSVSEVVLLLWLFPPISWTACESASISNFLNSSWAYSFCLSKQWKDVQGMYMAYTLIIDCNASKVHYISFVLRETLYLQIERRRKSPDTWLDYLLAYLQYVDSNHKTHSQDLL